MKKIVHPQQMPTAKLISLFLLFLCAGGILVYQLKSGQPISGQVIVSAAIAVLIASLLEGIPELLRLLDDRSRRGLFLEVFGKASGKYNVHLIFAHRAVKPSVKGPVFDTFYKPPCAQEPVPEGVKTWLSYQDVRAGARIAAAISKVTGCGVEFTQDNAIEDNLDKWNSVVSLGLGFNLFTDVLITRTKEKLFKVRWQPSERDESLGYTDQIEIPDMTGSYVEPANILRPSGNKDYAIIVRYVPEQLPDSKNRIFFLCAGRTAPGTAAAGYFLANNWEIITKLYKEAGKDLQQDSMLIVIEHVFRTDQLDQDDTAEIAEEEGKRFIRWYSQKENNIKRSSANSMRSGL